MTNKKLVPLEYVEQEALVRWIKLHPMIGDFLVKMDNEGKRSFAQAHYTKLMGLCVGASDLFLAYPTKRHHGLWIEVKRNMKYPPSDMAKPSWKAQERFLQRMCSVGFAGFMVFGWEHGVKVIEAYLSNTPMVA